MDLKQLFLFKNKNGQWHPWFCLHPFAVLLRCRNCNQEAFYFLAGLENGANENGQMMGDYISYSCGCADRPVEIKQEVDALFESAQCLLSTEKMQGEALYRIKLSQRLNSGEKFDGAILDDPDLLFLMDAFDIRRLRAEELVAEVRQEMNSLQAEEINQKTLENFKKIVETMRNEEGALTEAIKMHLVDIGIEKGLPRWKIDEIL